LSIYWSLEDYTKSPKEEDSIALEADALHLKADVIIPLGWDWPAFIWLTHLYFFDPIIAILIAPLS